MFNATFNNISAISWRSVLLVEETRVPGENRQVTDKLLSHNVVSSTPRLEWDVYMLLLYERIYIVQLMTFNEVDTMIY